MTPYQPSSQITIGKRETFCIQLKSHRDNPRTFNATTVWLNNRSVGRRDEVVALLPLLESFEEVLKSGADVADILDAPAMDAWQYARSTMNFQFPSTEIFDPLEVHVFPGTERLRFLWRIREDHRWLFPEESPLAAEATVNRAEMTQTIDTLRATFESFELPSSS